MVDTLRVASFLLQVYIYMKSLFYTHADDIA